MVPFASRVHGTGIELPLGCAQQDNRTAGMVE
jgi:hypothetical protein